MTIPLKNVVFEKIKDHGSLTDSELSKALIKDGFVIAEDRFNKLLLDLEIMGLIKVSWVTKDKRRIEIVAVKEEDEVDAQNKSMMEKDYEAGFPGVENN
jgi:hypothetical protein